ncbi:MAG: MerR family transcriptional regulator [Acidobacteriota bacterium]
MTRFTLEEMLARIGLPLPVARRFEEEGVIAPDVEEEGARFYSEVQCERLRVATTLLDLGVNDEGIEIILAMRERMMSLREEVSEAFSFVREAGPRADAARGEPRQIVVRIVG